MSSVIRIGSVSKVNYEDGTRLLYTYDACDDIHSVNIGGWQCI